MSDIIRNRLTTQLVTCVLSFPPDKYVMTPHIRYYNYFLKDPGIVDSTKECHYMHSWQR